MTQWVVVNPNTETVYGPFQTYTEACIWRDKYMNFSKVVPITPPHIQNLS